jgi:hypothetical protein
MLRVLPQVLDGDPVEFQFGGLTTEFVGIRPVADDLAPEDSELVVGLRFRDQDPVRRVPGFDLLHRQDFVHGCLRSRIPTFMMRRNRCGVNVVRFRWKSQFTDLNRPMPLAVCLAGMLAFSRIKTTILAL